MKKKFLLFSMIITATFILISLFGKGLVNNFLIKETAISYSFETIKRVQIKKGDYIIFGSYLNEPILWLVVDIIDKKPLIQTEYVIALKSFDAAHGNSGDIGQLGEAQWETSTLKKWLNSKEFVDYGKNPPCKEKVFQGYNNYEKEKGFLSENNFTVAQTESITNDGIFILSKNEIKKYFDTSYRKKKATKSAILQNESPYFITSSKNIWYWTSSPAGTNRTSVTTVNSAGGFYKSAAYDSLTGVCPALYLKSCDALCIFGNGSKEKPFVVKEVIE